MSNYIISTETTARENEEIGVAETPTPRTETKSAITEAYNADFDGDEMNIEVPIDFSVQTEIRDIVGDSDTKASPQEFHTPTTQRIIMRPSIHNRSHRVHFSKIPTTDEIIPVALFRDLYHEDLNDPDQCDFKLIPPSPSGFLNDRPEMFDSLIENPFRTTPAAQQGSRTPIPIVCNPRVRRKLLYDFERSM